MRLFLAKIFSSKFLFYTNSLGSGILMCVGDTVQQSIELYKYDKGRYNIERICHMGIIGLTMGPPQHFFYKYLDKFIPHKSLKFVFYKILLDQAIISPVCITIFLTGLGILENKSKQDILKDTQEKFLKIYTVDWLLWPPCQFINFCYINPKYRVSYVNIITVIYDVLLSYIKYEYEPVPLEKHIESINEDESAIKTNK